MALKFSSAASIYGTQCSVYVEYCNILIYNVIPAPKTFFVEMSAVKPAL